MSNANTATVVEVKQDAKPDVKTFKLTPKHKWHQEAASCVMEAGLTTVPGANMFYRIPETENVVQAATCIRDIFFHLLTIPEGTPFPKDAIRDKEVTKAWYKIYSQNPNDLLPEINDLGNDCQLMQFIFIGTTAPFTKELVKESLRIEDETSLKFIEQWWDQLRNIAHFHFSGEASVEIARGEKLKYTIDLPQLIRTLCNYHEIADLGYWCEDKDLLTNLVSCNISVHRVMNYISEELQIPRQDLRGRLNNDFYTDPETLKVLYELDASSIGDGGSNSYSAGFRSRDNNRSVAAINRFGAPMNKVYNDFCEHIFLNLSTENISDKAMEQRRATMQHVFASHSRYGHSSNDETALTISHWTYILRHAGWFNTNHRYVKDGVTTQHHGHEFLKHIKGMPAENLVVTPMELMGEQISKSHDQTVNNLAVYKFPQLPEELKALLPPEVEIINTAPQLYTEGTVMHHCCGGNGYMRSVSEGDSWFFHVTLPEDPTGVTVELDYRQGSMTFNNNQSRGLSNRMPTEKESTVIGMLIKTLNDFTAVKENNDWVVKAIKAKEPKEVEMESEA